MLKEFIGAIAIALLANSPAFADEVVTATKKPADGNIDIWDVVITSHVDDLKVMGIGINRGCLPRHNLKRPIELRFGQSRDLGYFQCDPIEVSLSTNQGNQTLSWITDPSEEFQVYTYRNVFYSPNFPPMQDWLTIVTSVEDQLPIVSVAVNRCNCRYSPIVENEKDAAGNLGFGKRIIVNSYECMPIEAEITTATGLHRIDLSHDQEN